MDITRHSTNRSKQQKNDFPSSLVEFAERPGLPEDQVDVPGLWHAKLFGQHDGLERDQLFGQGNEHMSLIEIVSTNYSNQKYEGGKNGLALKP